MTKHPAKFSPGIMTEIKQVVSSLLEGNPARRPLVVLDPFAGTGRIHELSTTFFQDVYTWGIEIEREWASMHDMTVTGDSRHRIIPACMKRVDVFVTSPCYGNRMADHHEARDSSKRNTYRHTLGRALTPGSAGAMQWGDAYRQLHIDVYKNMTNVYRRIGMPTWFILNMSDHIRKGKVVNVTAWHIATLEALGWKRKDWIRIPTRRQRQGENGHVRVEYEDVVVFQYDD